MSENKLTMRDMCEVIERAGIVRNREQNRLATASEIFNYSPTGELDMVFDWYEQALEVK